MKTKVLLADKSEIFREGLAKLLERETDIEAVCTCGTGLEAIERAHEHQPDVILIDTELSECSGIEAMQRIHEKLPNAKIIVLTHSEANTDLISAVKAGARAYISKDISLECLVKVINLVAEGEVIVSSPIAARFLEEIKFLEGHKGMAEVGGVSLPSQREQAVLSLVEQGLTNREISTTLFISEHTVKGHLRNVMGKFHAHTRQQAVVLAKEKATI